MLDLGDGHSGSDGELQLRGRNAVGFNCTGALTRTRYEAYDNTAAGTVPTELGFTGHVNDPDTGLVYMQQRYYDPFAARFMSVDPITTDANTGNGFNLYEYANNNPYRYVDPYGRDPWFKRKTLGSKRCR